MATSRVVLATVLIALCVSGTSAILDQVTDITDFIKPQIYPQSTFEFSMINGFIPVGTDKYPNSNSSLFFTLFTKKGETINNFNYTSTPLIFWFDGGPGCSSQYDFWGSVGALQYDPETGHILERNVTWNSEAMMVFIDQPLGTPWAYSDYPGVNVSSTVQAGEMIMEFFTRFYDIFVNMTNLPTYIFGESYAGHYVPYFAEQFHRNNIWGVPFKGIGVGDGWIDGKTQLQSYAEMYFQVSVASGAAYRATQALQIQALEQYEADNLWVAANITDQITGDTGGYGNLAQFGDVSSYNFMVYGMYGNGDAVELFQNMTFRAGYGIPSYIPPYEDCNATVYADFFIDNAASYAGSLEYLLAQADFKVLLYNGQLDMICNGQSVQYVINNLKWAQLWQWKALTKTVWKLSNQDVQNKVVGSYKANEQLCYATVYDAGHLVPEDQPEVAYDMLKHFLKWNWQ